MIGGGIGEPPVAVVKQKKALTGVHHDHIGIPIAINIANGEAVGGVTRGRQAIACGIYKGGQQALRGKQGGRKDQGSD